jgi:hypothetical protein
MDEALWMTQWRNAAPLSLVLESDGALSIYIWTTRSAILKYGLTVSVHMDIICSAPVFIFSVGLTFKAD